METDILLPGEKKDSSMKKQRSNSIPRPLNNMASGNTQQDLHATVVQPSSSGNIDGKNGTSRRRNVSFSDYGSVHQYHSINKEGGDEVENEDLEDSMTGSIFTPCMEDRLRRRLRFFFMNPCDKWKARKRFPWKLSLQLVKIVLVTIQLIIFGHDRSTHVNFLEKNKVTFCHLFLKGWAPEYETMPYPPATGAFAVYSIHELYSSIDYTWKGYYDTKDKAIGTYDYTRYKDGSVPPPMLRISRYKNGTIWPSNASYIFDSKILVDTLDMIPFNGSNKYDIERLIKENNKTINFDSLVNIEVLFSLETIHLKALNSLNSPDCFRFNITVSYDNIPHDGQVVITLEAGIQPRHCSEKAKIIHDNQNLTALKKAGILVLDVIVILISSFSLVLCARSLFRAEQLKSIVVKYFKSKHNKIFNWHEQMAFLNLWHVLIIVNDTLTICGTAFKLQIEQKKIEHYDQCGVLLGTGSLLVWMGVLRYLSFFDHYNLLVLTLKAAIPDILRFLVCAGIMYLAFTFCGWVVLGPYHIKFREIGTASECLFSLVNGDDMFVTFATIPYSSSYIYYYSRVYLYVFISLFMYVVYSIFTSIIITTYETIKSYYTNGFPKTDLMRFIDENPLTLSSPLYRQDSHSEQGCHCNLFQACQNCFTRDEYPDEYSPL